MKPDLDELLDLTRIYMSEVTDWHIQVAYLVGDGQFDEAAKALAAYNISIHKLAGAVSKMIPEGLPFLAQK